MFTRMSEEFEEMERIPWAALAAGTPDPRRRLIAAGVGLTALIALLLIAGRSLLGSGASTDPDLSIANGNSVTTMPATQSSVAPPTPAEPQTAATGHAVYSEADLMAASVDDEVRIAEMWAERFVRDYLTVDGNVSTAAEAARMVAADLPDPPAGLTSFVEWVDAYAIGATQPGRYRVEVAYRLLTGSTGSFVRQPSAAMAVTVNVDADGTAILAGLPELIPMPQLQPAAAPNLNEQIPEGVLASVSADSAAIVGAYRREGAWWVVLLSEIAPGVARQHIVAAED